MTRSPAREHQAAKGQRGWAHDAYLRLDRAREHTPGTLRALRRATAAVDRRDGLGPPPIPQPLRAIIPAWSSRAHYLRLLDTLAADPHVAAICRHHQVAVQTWHAIAVNDAYDADTATGSNMRTSQVVAAARVNRSEKTVQRARTVSRRLGILIELFRGYELSGEDRKALTAATPGHKQRGIANVYALTICPPRTRNRVSIPRPGRFAHITPTPQYSHSQHFVHLPTEGGCIYTYLRLKLLPQVAAEAAKRIEPPPAAHRRRGRRPGIGFAHTLITHPATCTIFSGAKAWQLAALLASHQAGGWKSHTLAYEIRYTIANAGIPFWKPAHSPTGLLAWTLDHIDPEADVHLAQPLDTPTPQPCTRPDCDGYGWINITQPNGRETARACPDCPPGIRNHTEPATDEPAF